MDVMHLEDSKENDNNQRGHDSSLEESEEFSEDENFAKEPIPYEIQHKRMEILLGKTINSRKFNAQLKNSISLNHATTQPIKEEMEEPKHWSHKLIISYNSYWKAGFDIVILI
jgi:hypothetical protein